MLCDTNLRILIFNKGAVITEHGGIGLKVPACRSTARSATFDYNILIMRGVRGMRDVLGMQMHSYRRVLDASQCILEGEYGYELALTNMVEPETLYRKTLGVTSDIVLKEMYEVRASGSNDEKERLVLRPEGTAGLLRAVLADKELMGDIRKKTVRQWYWGPMFRHERPQAGRLRQFYQIGVENIGGTKFESSKVDYGH